MPRTAVVLFNLGGPDSLDAVRPFLFNLFADPAILRVSPLVRPLLATIISRARAPTARRIYEQLGGRSPILEQTAAQANALAQALAMRGLDARVFIAMRYWHPRAKETALAVKNYAPGRVVLLPLYPQFSTTTTASSGAEFESALGAAGYRGEIRRICCFPTLDGFVSTTAEAIRKALPPARSLGAPRILLSAHGLPEAIVKAGDPYPWQVEASVNAVVAALGGKIDWRLCYQSRVGPMKWIGPSTDEEIEKAAREGRSLIVVPIAFVSEHSETLVELDIEYRKLAMDNGAAGFFRCHTVGIADAFIAGLADLAATAVARAPGGLYCNPRVCPAKFAQCPNH